MSQSIKHIFHDAGAPTAAARFELAHLRLAAEDEARSAWLSKRCKETAGHVGEVKPRKPCWGPACQRLEERSSGLCNAHQAQVDRGQELRPLQAITKPGPTHRNQ